MLSLGQTQTLVMVKTAAPGAYLSEDGSAESDTVLLPNSQVPEALKPGDSVEVFLYKDSEDRLIATTVKPKAVLHETALLAVKEMTAIGAFLEWGLAKDLLLPFSEQTRPVALGDLVLVALYIDKSSRLCATMKLYEYLKTDSPYLKDSAVRGTVYECIENFGVFVAVDNKYSALIPQKEVFREMKPGELIDARVTAVKPDGKLDLSLRQKTFIQINEDSLVIYRKLLSAGGSLPYNDKSSSDDIKKEFQMSKNAYKKAIGHLMKEGKIRLTETGIESSRI